MKYLFLRTEVEKFFVVYAQFYIHLFIYFFFSFSVIGCIFSMFKNLENFFCFFSGTTYS